MTRFPLSPAPRLILGVGLLATLVLGGTTAVRASNADATTASPPSICFVDRAGTTTTPPTAASGTVRLSVTVNAATRIRVNDVGEATSIATNSGCAPRASDDFIIEHGDTYTPALAATVAEALACNASGSWDDTTQWHNCD